MPRLSWLSSLGRRKQKVCSVAPEFATRVSPTSAGDEHCNTAGGDTRGSCAAHGKRRRATPQQHAADKPGSTPPARRHRGAGGRPMLEVDAGEDRTWSAQSWLGAVEALRGLYAGTDVDTGALVGTGCTNATTSVATITQRRSSSSSSSGTGRSTGSNTVTDTAPAVAERTKGARAVCEGPGADMNELVDETRANRLYVTIGSTCGTSDDDAGGAAGPAVSGHHNHGCATQPQPGQAARGTAAGADDAASADGGWPAPSAEKGGDDDLEDCGLGYCMVKPFSVAEEASERGHPTGAGNGHRPDHLVDAHLSAVLARMGSARPRAAGRAPSVLAA